MTVREAIAYGTQIISRRWPETPMLDASVILSYVMEVSREKLLASYPDSVPDIKFKEYVNAIEKRACGFPVSYITHAKEFYALDFFVNNHVLTPRSDTEILVETALEYAVKLKIPQEKIKIMDLCTGSGCIAISIKANLKSAQVWACDISDEALNVMLKNEYSIFGVNGRITAVKSDLLENIHEKFHIIVSNPPYLTTDTVKAMKNQNWPEPILALDGGTDGLDFIRKIIDCAYKNLEAGGYVFFEADPSQMEQIKKYMENNNFSDIFIRKDLAGRNRVIAGKLEYGKA